MDPNHPKLRSIHECATDDYYESYLNDLYARPYKEGVIRRGFHRIAGVAIIFDDGEEEDGYWLFGYHVDKESHAKHVQEILAIETEEELDNYIAYVKIKYHEG